jgi:hypothetical protein
MRIAGPDGVPSQDPLYDFPPEPMSVYGEPVLTPSAWPVKRPGTGPNDSTSRVISFVLGFALASLIAWLGNIRADRPAATPGTDAVATAGTPVVTGTTEVTKDSKAEELMALASLDAAAARPVIAPTSVAQKAVNSAPASSVPAAPVTVASASAPVGTVKAGRTQVTPAKPAQPKAPSPTASGYRGRLVLSSSPAGAEVTVNGQVVGVTPMVLNDLPVGSRALVVRRDGYSPWSTSVRIVADQQTTVQARLIPVP